MVTTVNQRRFQSHRLRNSILLLLLLCIVFASIVGYRTYRVYQSELPSFEQ